MTALRVGEGPCNIMGWTLIMRRDLAPAKMRASSHGFEPDTHDDMATMDWRISAPGLTALLLCFSTSGRFRRELDSHGRDRVRALLRAWVDHVLTPEGGPYVLVGPDSAVPIRDGSVMVDLLMSDQEAQGITRRSRTLLSVHVCLSIGNVFLAELLQLVAWPCEMAECALICPHTCEDRTRVANARDPPRSWNT